MNQMEQMTWTLWHRLRFPEMENRLTRRILKPRNRISWDMLIPQVKSKWLSELLSLVIFICFIFAIPFMLLAGFLLLVAAPILFLMLNGTLYGAYNVFRISGAIVEARESGLFQLLSVSPRGALGTSWLFCTLITNRNELLHQIHVVVRAVLIVIPATTAVIALFFISSLGQQAGIHLTLPFVLENLFGHVVLIAIIVMMYFDHVQSNLVACLTAMVVGNRLNNRLDAQVFSLLTFLMVQVLLYLVLFSINVIILPGFFILINDYGIGAALIQVVLTVMCFYGLREIMVRYMWHYLSEHLNADTDEVIHPLAMQSIQAHVEI